MSMKKKVIEFLDARPDGLSKASLVARVADEFGITKGNARYYVTRVWSKGIDVQSAINHGSIKRSMKLNKIALDAYKAGVADGTIECSEEELIDTVLSQQVVSYCGAKGTYTFDYYDIEYAFAKPTCQGSIE